MIESDDNAENKNYHVISAVILQNDNFGTFPKKFFDKLFFCKVHVLLISNLLKKTFWSDFVEPEIFNDWTTDWEG